MKFMLISHDDEQYWEDVGPAVHEKALGEAIEAHARTRPQWPIPVLLAFAAVEHGDARPRSRRQDQRHGRTLRRDSRSDRRLLLD